MKKTCKAAIAALVVTLCASFATAEMGMYLKGNLGYSNRSVPAKFTYSWVATDTYGRPLTDPLTGNPIKRSATIDTKWGYSLFKLTPTFGLMFRPDSDNIFWKGFGAEASLDFGFGGAVVINPGVMAKWHYYFPESWPVWVQKFVPYVGLGFSIPISVVSEDGYDESSYTSGGFDVNINIGFGWELMPKLMLTLDYDLGLGTSMANAVSIGVVYKIKGERNIQQVGEMPEYWKQREEAKKRQELIEERNRNYPNSRAPGETEDEYQSRTAVRG